MIETYQFGKGTLIKWGFNSSGKLYWLASFPDYGRQFVTARHLVSIDFIITNN